MKASAMRELIKKRLNKDVRSYAAMGSVIGRKSLRGSHEIKIELDVLIERLEANNLLIPLPEPPLDADDASREVRREGASEEESREFLRRQTSRAASRRSGRREPSKRRPTAEDKRVLREVQEWSDKSTGVAPQDWEPTPAENNLRRESGQVYWEVDGVTMRVTEEEYAQMTLGNSPFPCPQPTKEEQTLQAKKLASISVLGTDCEVCRRDLGDDAMDTESMVRKLVNQEAVLPYINRQAEEHQVVLSFSGRHFLCRLVQPRVTQTLIDTAGQPRDEKIAAVDAMLEQSLTDILAEAQQKRRRSNYTETDVLETFVWVGEALEGGGKA